MAGARDGTKVSVCIKPREPGGYRLSVRDCRRGVCYAGCAARGYVPCLASHDSNSTQTLLSASASPLSLVALRQPAYSLRSRPRSATMVFKLRRPSTQYRLTFGPRGRPSSRLIRGRSHREFQSPGLLRPSAYLGRSSSDRPTEIVSETRAHRRRYFPPSFASPFLSRYFCPVHDARANARYRNGSRNTRSIEHQVWAARNQTGKPVPDYLPSRRLNRNKNAAGWSLVRSSMIVVRARYSTLRRASDRSSSRFSG